MKRFLTLFTVSVLSCVIFASCRIDVNVNNGNATSGESLDFSESTTESFEVSDSENTFESKENDESEDVSESVSELSSEAESDGRENGVYYIILDYNRCDEKNEVKRIAVKKGEKIFGLPEKVYSSSNSDFEYWAYNGKKIKNGMVFDYDYDITLVASYAEWTGNY